MKQQNNQLNLISTKRNLLNRNSKYSSHGIGNPKGLGKLNLQGIIK